MNKEYLIYKLSDEVKNSCKIDNDLFQKYGVKRGLRNEDGSGVLVGLTNIGNVVGYERSDDGHLEPTEGKLFYRGYELDDLVTPIIMSAVSALKKSPICFFREICPTKRILTHSVSLSTRTCRSTTRQSFTSSTLKVRTS